MTRADVTDAALVAARLEGCTCDPDVELEERLHAVIVAHLYHERRCHLLGALTAKDN